MAAAPHVLVLMVNYNSAADSIQCISALQKSSYSNFSVFVVDNASTDRSAEALEAFIKPLAGGQVALPTELQAEMAAAGKVILVKSNENQGFASGNNQVLRHAINWNTWIWLLNPDTIPHPDAMHFLVEDASENRRKVMGTKVFSLSDPNRLLHLGAATIQWNSATISPLQHPNQPIDYIYGGSLFTHSSVFQEFGLLPSHYFLYWEETDWCYQLKLAGIPLELSARAIVYDKVGGSIGRGYFAFFYYTRNGLWFTQKYKPQKVKIVLFFNVLRTIKRVLSGQFSIARAIADGTLAGWKST